MRKITYIIAGLFLLIGSVNANAQMDKQACTLEYNFYKGDIQSKDFASATTRLNKLMTDCPTLSVNVYKLGEKIVDNMISTGDKTGGLALREKIFNQRIKNYTKDLGKVINDYANFIAKNGGTEQEVFGLLERAYKANPSGMSAKNIYKYFDIILEKNKDTDAQKILDTYDDILDALEVKAGVYQQRLSKLITKEEGGATLSKREATSKRIATATLKNIGIINVGLAGKIDAFLTCERIIPIYTQDFDANSSNAQWLKRAVSKMYNKECTEDPLYEKLATAYAQADPSSDAYIFLSRILEKKGKTAEAIEMQKKAIDLEQDPIKKSKYLMAIAQDLSRKGQKSQARRYANQAIASNPSNGAAYLLIGSMYATSANSCGTDLFGKRMVYVAALRKARRAAVVDPSIASKARRYINSYSKNIPTKTEAFGVGIKEGDSYKIGCWIGETVRVTLR